MDRTVSVIGASGIAQDSELAERAEEVGRRLAEAGVRVVCGGMDGVMEAVSRGAAQAGGTVIGILPGLERSEEANPHCTHIVATGTGHTRNLAVVASGDVAIAVGGAWGTLSEIALARAIGRQVVSLGSWDLSAYEGLGEDPGVTVAGTPEEAVATALALLPDP
jgi:uncharacterized protein (TIGR00725 family)